MKRFLPFLFCCLLMLTMVTGCQSHSASPGASNSTASSKPAAGNTANDMAAVQMTANEKENSSQTDLANIPVPGERKIVWYVDLEMETLSLDPLLDKLDQTVKEMGGYLESSSVSGNASANLGNRYSTVTVRVPSDKLDSFLNQMGNLGTVTYTNRRSEDITLDYVDVESRISVLRTEEQRLLELLESAQDLEAVIQLESRLSEVRYQLENYTSTKNRFDSLVDYSTVTLSIREVQRVTAIADQSVGQRISAGWSNTIYKIQTGCVNFFVWFVVNLPFLLFWGIVVGAIVFFVVRRAKKRIQK